MATLMIRARVEDYERWRPLYERAAARAGARMTCYRIWRGLDDRNLVYVAETFSSREAGEQLLADPAIQAEMAEHGVDATSVQVAWVDEVASTAGAA